MVIRFSAAMQSRVLDAVRKRWWSIFSCCLRKLRQWSSDPARGHLMRVAAGRSAQDGNGGWFRAFGQSSTRQLVGREPSTLPARLHHVTEQCGPRRSQPNDVATGRSDWRDGWISQRLDCDFISKRISKFKTQPFFGRKVLWRVFIRRLFLGQQFHPLVCFSNQFAAK